MNFRIVLLLIFLKKTRSYWWTFLFPCLKWKLCTNLPAHSHTNDLHKLLFRHVLCHLKSILKGWKVSEPMKVSIAWNLNILILLRIWTLLYFFLIQLKPLTFVRKTKTKTKQTYIKIIIISYLEVALLYPAYHFLYQVLLWWLTEPWKLRSTFMRILHLN